MLLPFATDLHKILLSKLCKTELFTNYYRFWAFFAVGGFNKTPEYQPFSAVYAAPKRCAAASLKSERKLGVLRKRNVLRTGIFINSYRAHGLRHLRFFKPCKVRHRVYSRFSAL